VTVDDLREELRRFVRARDWEQFHSPKNLAMGTAAEAGELLEIFLWLTEDESRTLDESHR
jgi:dCTP diphosphatase